jgi:diguanylate cyclase (GGDEF)-like protein
MFWQAEYRNAEQSLENEFEIVSAELANSVQRHIDHYELALLGARAHIHSSGFSNARSFGEYVDSISLAEHYSGIQCIGLVEVQSNRLNQLRTKVVAIEPNTKENAFGLGADLYAVPIKRAAMDRARDMDAAVLTDLREKPHLQLADKMAISFMMFVPIFEQNKQHETASERRNNISGWIYASIDIKRLMEEMLASEHKDVDIEIFGGKELTADSLMFDRDNVLSLERNDSHYQLVRKLIVAGQTWTVLTRSLQKYEEKLNPSRSIAVLAAGIFVSLVLWLFTWLLTHSRKEAIKLAELLSESQLRLQEMFENMSSGVAVYRVSEDGQKFHFSAFNKAAERMNEIPRQQILGKEVTEVFPGISRMGLIDVFRRVNETGNAEHFPAVLYEDGRISGWVENFVYKLPGGEIVAIFDDITAQKSYEEKMHNLAHSDALTGLPNRRLFMDRMQQAINSAKRTNSILAIMFIDLDKFKPINDELGHEVGDLILKEVALRLKSSLRESDTAARIGGDEFVVLLPALETSEYVLAVAEKIRLALEKPFEAVGKQLSISCSIGIALYPEHGTDTQILVKNADAAMYQAKSEGRNTIRIFTN